MRAPAMSLDAPSSGDPEGRSLGELVPDEDAADPESQMASTELGGIVRDKLTAFAATLEDERERAIWKERLIAPEPASLSDLGDQGQTVDGPPLGPHDNLACSPLDVSELESSHLSRT